MALITVDQFAAMACRSAETAAQWYPHISQSMEDWEINTPERVAGFMAQMAMECDHFTVFEENLNYSIQGLMKTWPSRFPTQSIAAAYAHNPEKIANMVYGDRGGNVNLGDGWLYRGRGPMMLTFADNYRQCMKETGIPRLLQNPDILLQPEHGARMSGWYWQAHGCNELMDAGNFRQVTVAIDGGLIGYEDGNTVGLDDRVELWTNARQVLGLA